MKSKGGFLATSTAAIPCRSEQAILGEGVCWDTRRAELLHVDILAGRVFRHEIAEDGDLVPVRSYSLSGSVGAIAPIQGDDGWVLAAGGGFAYLSQDGELRTIAEVAPEGTRMNDGACDPRGCFWAGTMAEDYHDGGGSLYRLDQFGKATLVLDGLTIPNGPCWSPDGHTMYLVDSRFGAIFAFAFDAHQGSISERKELIRIPEEYGWPDGMTVDNAGDLWIALYRGGCVRRYTCDGELRQVLKVPIEDTTCCAFGGDGLGQLYVTTATQGWSVEQREAEPGAGIVYRLSTDATGRPAEAFRPDLGWWSEFAV